MPRVAFLYRPCIQRKRPQVKVMTDSEVEVSLPSPAPTSDDYVGCFSDMVGDRVLTIVATDDALIPAVSVFSRIILRYHATS